MAEETPLIRSLRSAVEAAPDDVPLRLHLAELLLGEGRTDKAVAEIAAALQRAPGDAQAGAPDGARHGRRPGVRHRARRHAPVGGRVHPLGHRRPHRPGRPYRYAAQFPSPR
ncbi:tetratricopeptide repeat protein [Streptomyces sp. NPDC051776]|uniref:tetratricopeptide repeat protein n=1 Tax=Streptomyces sp. NPDC051776 TaxID=3155414 RepID=UPI00343EA591